MEQHDRPVGIGVIGAGWLGDVHARAWARLRHHYPDLAVAPRFAAVADAVPGALEAAQRKHGFANLVRRLARPGRRPPGRRGQRHGTERDAPRARYGGGRGREAPVDREARRTHAGRRARGRSSRSVGGRPGDCRLQLPRGPRDGAAARAGVRGCDRPADARTRAAVHRLCRAPDGCVDLALYPRRRRPRCAGRPGLARRRPHQVRARRPRGPGARRPTSSSRSGRFRRRARSATATAEGPRVRRPAGSRTRTTSQRWCGPSAGCS